ncbi:MAG: hypothetical protein JOZ10_09905 [Acidobacteria bacterium]|nr:hypothetical protein [Acidobacteriota bacterium]MBV9146651.1 hypothetical protein [Acidobacteriota bacterium]MBV9435624.1 hypothetical protein [Acidobacteriota bacterium]
MTKKKAKKEQARARKVRSRGLWIAPDLERKIKGEGGRRGLSEPPYSYYLQLADLALSTSTPTPHPAAPAKPPRSTEPLLEPWSDIVATSPSDVFLEPASPLPTSQPTEAPDKNIPNPPKRPKLNLPRPPKAPSGPRPAKPLPTAPLHRPAPKKLAFPKPPKRGR